MIIEKLHVVTRSISSAYG